MGGHLTDSIQVPIVLHEFPLNVRLGFFFFCGFFFLEDIKSTSKLYLVTMFHRLLCFALKVLAVMNQLTVSCAGFFYHDEAGDLATSSVR